MLDCPFLSICKWLQQQNLNLCSLFVLSGWWRWHINKLVGTEEAWIPCTSCNTECHSTVWWTGTWSFKDVFCTEGNILGIFDIFELISDILIYLFIFFKCFSSMIPLRSTAHRRLQIGKMNTRPGADRWSSHPSVSTRLQMVKFVIIFVLIKTPPFTTPFHGSLETIGWLFYPSTAMQYLAPIAIVSLP